MSEALALGAKAKVVLKTVNKVDINVILLKSHNLWGKNIKLSNNDSTIIDHLCLHL